MRTRQGNVWLRALSIAATATILIATGGCGASQEELEFDRPPGTTEVIVVLTCTSNGAGVRVNPYRRDLDPEETVTWNRVGGYSGEYAIEPDGDFPWTLTPAGGTSSRGRVEGAPPAGGVDEGEYMYKVTFMCNGERVELDPRMEVPRR
jgi:hypothetical protein